MERERHTTAGVLLLVALASVVTAGAASAYAAGDAVGQVNGTNASDGANATGAENVTGTENVTGVENASGAEFPTGVNESGVANASELVSAHQAALSDTGYTYNFSQNVSISLSESGANESVGVNGTPADVAVPGNATSGLGLSLNDTSMVSTENGTVAEGLAPSYVVTAGSVQFDGLRQNVSAEQWANESVLLFRVQMTNQEFVQRVDFEQNATENPLTMTRDSYNASLTKADVLGMVLETGEFEVTSEQTDNGTLYTLEGTDANNSNGTYFDDANVSTYDATVVVDEEGLIRQFSFDLETTEPDRISMHYDFEIGQLGEVEVTQPEWTQNASGTATQNATGMA